MATAQQRAVIEALGLTANDLRELAAFLDAAGTAVLVQHLVDAALDRLPDGHLYVTSLRRLAAWAGERDAVDVRGTEIDAWARRARDEARTQPNGRHGLGAQEAFVLAARAAYALAVEAGRLHDNPAAEVAVPARPTVRRSALSPDRLRAMHTAVVGRSRDPYLDDLVFRFLRETGSRRAGVIGLVLGDVAPATRTAHVVEKYGKERWQPLSAHLVELLLAHASVAGCRCGRAFHRADGGHLTDRWFDGFARRAQRLPWAAELGVSAHWLRHTTVTDVERLAGIRVAAEYAGHADASLGVTGSYTKVSTEELQLAHARLFFDDPADADDPTVAPLLFRRVLPAATGPVEFAA